MRLRLDVTPTASLPGRTYLVFPGTTGGGMVFGKLSKKGVSEPQASAPLPHEWFSTLSIHRALSGPTVTRARDEGNDS